MTPEQRAEKILRIVTCPTDPYWDSALYSFAAEIREAVDEGLNNFQSDVDSAIRKARAEAFEEASKVAESFKHQEFGVFIADAIRALKETEK